MTARFLRGLGLGLFLFLPSSAAAEEWPRLTISYVSETATNVSGGDRTRVTETGQLGVGATFDLERMIGIHGGKVQSTITYRSGSDLGKVADLGLLQQAQEVYGRGQTLRLTQLWYAQDIGDYLEVKVGRVTVGEDIGAFSCEFMNLSFCGAPPGAIIGNYWFNWPVSQWGGRIRAKSSLLYATTGAYEVNPLNLEHGLTLGYFHGATGALLPIEVGFTPKVGKSGLPGTYKLGAWLDTSQNRHGAFGEVQQQLTGRAGNDGLVGFASFTQADRATTRIDNQLAAGFFYTGITRFRPRDEVGIGMARTHLDERVAGRLPGKARSAEHAFELFYAVHAFAWLVLRPDAQLVVDPGAVSSAHPVVVLGLKAAITL